MEKARWIKKGKILWSILNTAKGELKTIHTIEEVHVNTVRFTTGKTQMNHLLRQITEWIPIDEYEPQGEVLCLNNDEEMLIGYYSDEESICESDFEVLYSVTHFMPKIELD